MSASGVPCDLISNCTIIGAMSNSSSFQFRCGVPPSLPPTVPSVINNIQAAIILITIILSLLFNGFVLFLVARYKTLQVRAFYLTLQLVASNLVFTGVVLVTEFVSAVTGEWMFGEDMCQVSGFLHDGLASMRFLLTLTFTLDRFFTVFLPFYYAKHGGRVSALMSVVAWIISVIRVSIPLRSGLDCYAYLPTFKTCTSVSCNETCQAYILTFVGITTFLGGFGSFFLYLILFMLGRNKRKKIKVGLQMDARTNIDSKVKRDRRATVTFLILFIALVGCTTPPLLLYMVSFALPNDEGPDPVLLIFQIIVGRTFFNALTVVDPIVLMRNRDVREVLVKMKHQCCVQLGTSEASSVGTNTTSDTLNNTISDAVG